MWNECLAIKPDTYVDTEMYYAERFSAEISDVRVLKEFFPLYVSSVGDTITRIGVIFPSFPTERVTTKKGLLRWMDEDVSRWVIFSVFVGEVLVWLRREANPGVGMPLYANPKHEPIPAKKINAGQHRSIQYPIFVVSMIERYFSSWIQTIDGVPRLRSVDDLMAMHGSLASHTTTWLSGSTAVKTRDFVAARASKGALISSLDVSGWDRSLDRRVILHLFSSVIRDKRVAVSCANGYCGDGTYIIDNQMFAFIGDVTLWCSGCNLTLAGNCLMHAGLLRSMGLIGVVQGDDAILISAGTEQEIVSSYAKFGLKLKQVDQSETTFNFCKDDFVLNGGKWFFVPAVAKKIDKIAAAEKDHYRSLTGIFNSLAAELNRFEQPDPSMEEINRITPLSTRLWLASLVADTRATNFGALPLLTTRSTTLFLLYANCSE